MHTCEKQTSDKSFLKYFFASLNLFHEISSFYKISYRTTIYYLLGLINAKTSEKVGFVLHGKYFFRNIVYVIRRSIIYRLRCSDHVDLYYL